MIAERLNAKRSARSSRAISTANVAAEWNGNSLFSLRIILSDRIERALPAAPAPSSPRLVVKTGGIVRRETQRCVDLRAVRLSDETTGHCEIRISRS